jgi:hypothetical protein
VTNRYVNAETRPLADTGTNEPCCQRARPRFERGERQRALVRDDVRVIAVAIGSAPQRGRQRRACTANSSPPSVVRRFAPVPDTRGSERAPRSWFMDVATVSGWMRVSALKEPACNTSP